MNLSPVPKFREASTTGAPLAGGLLYTAQPGTVPGPGQSFPKSTYTDVTGQTANPNPAILGADGRADIWLNGSYAMALYDTNGLLIYTEDDVNSQQSGAGATQQIVADATLAVYNANILAASDASAPQYYEIFKTDASANPVVITPASGTIQGQPTLSLTTQGEGVRLTANISTNDWMKF